MKTLNKLLAGIVVVALSVMLPSCGIIIGPDNWDVEIEDSFREQLAIGLAYLKFDKNEVDKLSDDIDELAEVIDDEHSSDNSVAKYKLALEQMAPHNTGVEQLLQVYNSLEVKFSKWEKLPEQDGFSVWTATERNTGIKVIFKNSALLDWNLKLDDVTFGAYMENAAQNQTKQKANNSSKDKWLLSYWKKVMGTDFDSQDEQFLRKKYPSGVTTEAITLSGEYMDDEDITEIVPTEDVIMNMVAHHYSDPQIYDFPTPKCVGEFYAKVYKLDYYKHIDLNAFCHVNQLCMDLVQAGTFDDFVQKLPDQTYPPVKLETIQSAKTQQEKDICRVLNEWAYIALGNGGANPTTELFGEYFDFLE